MKKIVLSIVALMTVSFSAQAGIKDKKAMKTATEVMNSAIAKVKTSCGSSKLEGKIDWSNWDTYDYKKMSIGRGKDAVLTNAGTLLNGVIGEMATLCKDADFKEEIAKVTSIAVSGNKDQSYRYADFKLDGTTLNMVLNADTVGSWKNKDSLKKVWE